MGLGFSLAAASGGERIQGAFALTDMSGQLEVGALGGVSQGLDALEQPHYFPGLLRVESSQAGHSLWLASNLLALYHQGPFFLEVIRFEQSENTGADLWTAPRESGHSRMLLRLQGGLAAFDSTALSAASRLTLELPVGEVFDKRGVWSVKVEKHEQEEYYRFSIECYSGSVVFVDPHGQSYVLGGEQMLLGAGTALNPVVEVGATRGLDHRLFQRVSAEFDRQRRLPLSAAAALDLMPRVASLANVEAHEALSAKAASLERHEPIFIEHSASPRPLIYFRGVRKPIFRGADASDLE